MLDAKGWSSVMKGGVVAAVGAGLTYVLQHVGGVQLGESVPFVAAGLAVLTNILRKTFGIGESA